MLLHSALTPSFNTQSGHEVDGGFIYLDAHVLTTPAIADIDGDGQEDLVLAVSYFYDRSVCWGEWDMAQGGGVVRARPV